MLVQFMLKNVLSFKEETILDLTAINAYKEHQCNLIDYGTKEKYLRVAAIYGANASGKTNLFIALLRMKAFMLASVGFDKKSTYLFCEPFALSKGMDNCTEMERLLWLSSSLSFPILPAMFDCVWQRDTLQPATAISTTTLT